MIEFRPYLLREIYLKAIFDIYFSLCSLCDSHDLDHDWFRYGYGVEIIGFRQGC